MGFVWKWDLASLAMNQREQKINERERKRDKSLEMRWGKNKIKGSFFYSLFLLLFIGLIALFGTIHESHYIISVKDGKIWHNPQT